MRDIDKQWLLASPSSRVRFQSILFPRGLVYDYEQHRFGSSEMGPLYRLVATKKDFEEPSKSFLVAQVHSNWNLICEELLRWKELIEVGTVVNGLAVQD